MAKSKLSDTLKFKISMTKNYFFLQKNIASTNPTILLENYFALLREHMGRTIFFLFQCINVDQMINFRPNELQ